MTDVNQSHDFSSTLAHGSHRRSTAFDPSVERTSQVLRKLLESIPPPSELSGDDATVTFCSPDQAENDGLPRELADHPRYRVIALLGRGGMGTLYVAQHRLMEREIALKVIRGTESRKPDVIERFKREIKVLAQLSHPNIVIPYDAENDGDILFLAMEYIRGADLRSVVREGGPLPMSLACTYIRQAASGLDHAHRRGIVHRDIKPSNLMLTHRERAQSSTELPAPEALVKILDFGLARFLQDTGQWIGTPSGFTLGTLGYIAPEQARDAHTAGVHADIYSLGCTLYFLLTGVVPLRGPLMAIIRGEVEPVPLVEVSPRLDSRLIQIVNRMMAKEATERYSTCAEVEEALACWCAQAEG